MKIRDKKRNNDLYFEWSTIVDAPITYGMSLEEFKQYYKDQYGKEGMRHFDDYMKVVEQKGIYRGWGNEDVQEFLKSAFECNKSNGGNRPTSIKQLIEGLYLR